MQQTNFERPLVLNFSVILVLLQLVILVAGIWYNYTFFIPLLLKKEWINFFGINLYTPSIFGIKIYVLAGLVQISWVGLFCLGFLRRTIYTKRKELVLFCVVLFILLVGMEIGIRVVDPQVSGYSPHHYLDYYLTPNWNDKINMHNSLGFRGPEIETPKPTGMYRIVTMGGSTTYETGVLDWHDDFARRLQWHLRNLYNIDNIEVINAGCGGWTSWEDLINLHTRVLALEPDMIIEYQGLNDLNARMVAPESYKSDNSGRRKQYEEIPMIFRLRLVSMFIPFKPYEVDATTTSSHGENVYSEILGMTRKEVLFVNEPTYFKTNLKNIVAIARENSAVPVLATFAYSNEFDNIVTTEHYKLGFEQMNQVIKDVADEDNVNLYDFAEEMSNDSKYWVDGRHNNEIGVNLKGKLFAEYLYKNDLIKFYSEKEINLKNSIPVMA